MVLGHLPSSAVCLRAGNALDGEARSCASLFWALTPWHMWQRRCLWNGARCSHCSSPMLVGAPRTLGAGLGSGTPCYPSSHHRPKKRREHLGTPLEKSPDPVLFSDLPGFSLTEGGCKKHGVRDTREAFSFPCSYIP